MDQLNSTRKELNLICGNSKGFTLVEIMIAMVLGLYLMSKVYDVLITQQKAYSVQDQVVESMQNARVGVDFMTRDLRMVGYIAEEWITGGVVPNADVNDAGNGFSGDGTAEDIDEASATAFTFEADIDADDKTETVRYSYNTTDKTLDKMVWEWDSANTIWVADANGLLPIAENVSSLTFTYLDKNAAVTATRANMRLIKIAITAKTEKPDPNTGQYRTRTLSAKVRPRNLGL